MSKNRPIYIDGSKLLDKFNTKCKKAQEMYQALADAVTKEAADVSETKHGHNATAMHPVDEFVCSECGFACEGFTEIVTDEDGDYQYQRECEFDYCPKCGAEISKGS